MARSNPTILSMMAIRGDATLRPNYVGADRTGDSHIRWMSVT